MPYTYANLARSVVRVARPQGGATLTVAAGDGPLFGSPTPASPMRVVVYSGKNLLTILHILEREGDDLILGEPVEGYSDVEIPRGAIVANVLLANDLGDLWKALEAIEVIEGPPGERGADGAPGSVWREGLGAPDDATGIDGDFYLDASSGDVYHRESGSYTIVANLSGPAGKDGKDGADGADGSPGPPGVGSFGLSMPGGFSVSGSPLTESGTIVVSTDLVGLIKASDGSFTAAVAGVDYATPAQLADVVTLAGSQTIVGQKTFGRVTIRQSGDTDWISTSGRELVLEATGDTFGTVRLRLLNRGGANGVIFENVGVGLVDYLFRAGGLTRNPRFESRGPAYGLGVINPFLFGPAGNFHTAIGDDKSVFTRPLHTQGGRVIARSEVSTTPFSATLDHHLLAVTGPAEPRTVNLPTGAATGQIFVVVDEAGDAGGHPITISAPAGGAINGSASATIDANHGALTIYCAGSNKYFIIGRG